MTENILFNPADKNINFSHWIIQWFSTGALKSTRGASKFLNLTSTYLLIRKLYKGFRQAGF